MRFEILVPIWGEKYIENFCNLGLKSVLAPENLPWLCAEHDVNVTVLTTRASHRTILAQPAFERISGIAKLALVDIDDLIEAYERNYALILTRAYNRAMALNSDMIGTSFIYLVGDLVFSNGAFREIARAIEAGSDACLMCSPRVDADVVEPLLVAQATDTELALAPRQLAAYLMAFPHPTLVAKTLKDDTIRLSIAHQYFWRPRPDTMVARCFLQHMICIRPTRRPLDIPAPCDYAFAAELAPSGRWHYFEDSDSLLVLEMQGTVHEIQFITMHPLTVDDVAEALSHWTTAQHRAFSQATFVYKSGESCYPIDEGRSLTTPFVDTVLRQLPPPKDHLNHVFWLGAFGLQPITTGALPGEVPPGTAAPSALTERIAYHLERLGDNQLRLAVSVAAGDTSPVDAILVRAARVFVRAQPDQFYRYMEDIASPGDPFMLVVSGGTRDFLEIFASRTRLSRLLRLGGPQRPLILCFEIDRAALSCGATSRTALHQHYAASLGILAHFGLSARIHDLSLSPLDGCSGFVVEIVADEASGAALGDTFRDGRRSLLYGQRGGERRALIPEEPTIEVAVAIDDVASALV